MICFRFSLLTYSLFSAVTLTIPSQTTLAQAATITCTHSAYSLDSSEGTLSVSIYKNGEALSGASTSGTSTTYSMSSLTGTDSGKYKCVATYGNYGEMVTSEEDYKIIDATDITPTMGITGQELYLTCHTYGELVDSSKVAWQYNSGSLPTGVAVHPVPTDTTNDNKFYRPFYLKIDALANTNTGSYSCAVTFSTGTKTATLASISAKQFGMIITFKKNYLYLLSKEVRKEKKRIVRQNRKGVSKKI